jgi:hypothetical protein
VRAGARPSHPFGAAVGRRFGDSDGDGRDEIVVTVADGYRTACALEIAAPEAALDRSVVDRSADRRTWGRSTLEATGRPWLAPATEVAVVDTDGAYVTSPAWRDAGTATTLLIADLPRQQPDHRVSVRAISSDGGRSTDTANGGVRVRFAAECRRRWRSAARRWLLPRRRRRRPRRGACCCSRVCCADADTTDAPDFMIIGAMKAGTTTLYRDLEAQPGCHAGSRPAVLVGRPPTPTLARYAYLYRTSAAHQRRGGRAPAHATAATRAWPVTRAACWAARCA